ncbi:MAG: ABC transporter substrate-binding protein [Acidobacteriota bacterium]
MVKALFCILLTVVSVIAFLDLLSAAELPSKKVSADSSHPIKIAYVGGLTGPVSQAAQKSLKALKLIANQWNRKGGLLNRKIEVLAFDTQSLAIAMPGLFKKIKASGAVAITGVHTSNEALLLAPLADQNKIPLVIASATHPAITKNRRFVIRTCFNDDLQGNFLATSARQSLHSKKAIIVVDVSDSFTLNLAETFKKKFSTLGGKIVAEYSIRTGDQKFDLVSNSLRTSKDFDLIFAATSSVEAAYLISQLSEEGIEANFLGSDGWQNQDLSRILETLHQSSKSSFFSAHWHRNVQFPAAARFISEFEKEYEQPITSFDADTVLTYDAGLLLLNAIRAARSTDPHKIIAALKKVSVNGVTGPIKINRNGEPKKKIFLLQILRGRVSVWQ